MPTLLQLPPVTEVAAEDLLLIEQQGTTAVASVGLLREGLQAELSVPGETLLGRIGPVGGAPEPIGIGAGLMVADGQLAVDGGVVALSDSPALIGHPTAPTPMPGDTSNAIATTAYVQNLFAPGAIALGGDIAGSGAIGGTILATLPDITTPGSYSKITVNAKGQVVAGAALTASDIAGLATVAQTGAYTDLFGAPAPYVLPSTLPNVDGSAVLVKSTLSGALARPLGEMRGEVIRVADFLGAPPNGQDATAAMVTALSLAANRGGGIVELAAGVWSFTTMGAPFSVPSHTTVRGAGRHLTSILWDDTTPYNLFSAFSSASVRAVDIEFCDFTVTGSWQTNGVGGTYPFLMSRVDGLQWRNVCSEYSRVMGIVARNCTDVTVRGCVVRYSARDGINLAECAAVTIEGNTVEHCDDDGIAVHSDIFDPWVVRKNVVIANNRVFDCQGIKVLAPRATAVIGNVVDCCRSQGISFATEAATLTSTEGMSAAMVSLICGNVVTNIINRQNIDNLNQNAPGIYITGDSARAGTLAAPPGEAKASNATVIDPYPYFAANSNLSTVATTGSHSLIVANNFIGRLLPACNGTVTSPKLYAHYSDYGFGQMFTRNGWLNPQLAESDMMGGSVVLTGGVIRDVLITGNVMRGMLSGLVLGDAVRLENISFRGNQVIDCRSYGVLVNTTATMRAYIDDNIFDLDPFFRSSLRGAGGTWTALGEPTGIKVQSGSGGIVRRNVVRNLNRDSDIPTDTVSAGWLFDGNLIEADPVTVGFSTANKGVGQIRAAAGVLLTQVECNPGSVNFGKILTTPTGSAISMPASGKWLSGHFVRNATPAVSGGLMTLGWARLTTGSGNVLGTDWSQALAVGGSVSASAVLAGPTSGSAVPTFRQLSAADISGAAAAPTVTGTYTASGTIAPGDNVALVNAAVAVSMTLGAGTVDGHPIVVKRFGVGAVTLTATIDGIAGAQVRLSSAGLKESVSLAWSQGLASWLMI